MENNDSSDSSDEDYVPEDNEVLSEEEDSGEEELPRHSDDETDAKGSQRPQRRKNLSREHCHLSSSRRATKRTNSGGTERTAEKQTEGAEIVKNIDEKEKVDRLWADFLKAAEPAKPEASSKDINKLQTAPSSSSVSAADSSALPSSSSSGSAKPNKVTVLKEYKFAGEIVTVSEEIDADSKEAREAVSSTSSTPQQDSPSSSAKPVSMTLKRPAGSSGLGAVLGKLNKKPKLSTLEKSKLDWDGFKQKEGIGEELKIHNRGKEGYLERVAFLQRADQRQYERERDMRLGSSQKR